MFFNLSKFEGLEFESSSAIDKLRANLAGWTSSFSARLRLFVSWEHLFSGECFVGDVNRALLGVFFRLQGEIVRAPTEINHNYSSK